MSVCVVVVPERPAALWRLLLPPTDVRAHGAARVYLFYDAQGSDLAFRDVDGELLIESRKFVTLAEAKAWAAEDVRQRNIMAAQARSVQ
jgi:hypothetical protein